jgi:hypothetical protein
MSAMSAAHLVDHDVVDGAELRLQVVDVGAFDLLGGD